MTDSKIRLGVIGLGRFGFTLAHATELVPEIEIVNCYTRTESKGKEFSETFNCEQSETFESFIENKEMDGIIIAAPNNRHTEIAVAAAENGKHVFTEKPIASTISDSKVMISECNKAGITLAVGHTYRRLNSHRFLKKMVDEGELGNIAMAEANYSNDRGLFYTPDNWQWFNEGSPGGPLMQVAIHVVDSLYYLFGPVKKVSAAFNKIVTKSEIPDVCTMWMEFESGVLGTIGTSFISPRSPKGRFTYLLNAYGDKANFYLDRWDGVTTLKEGSDSLERVFEKDISGKELLAVELKDFADSVLKKREPEVSGNDGLHNVAVVWAAIESSERGESVEIQEMLA